MHMLFILWCFIITLYFINNYHYQIALFRAEVKKELTFFRGCPAIFSNRNENISEITTEGKTTQIVKFVKWLNALGSEETLKWEAEISMSSILFHLTIIIFHLTYFYLFRKPNFQGPRLDVSIEDTKFMDFVGEFIHIIIVSVMWWKL